MSQVFLRLFNISATAGWIVAAVLLLRLLFRQMPKWVSCLMWGIVGLRLILPVTLESTVSLLPSAQVIPQNIAVAETPAIYSGIPAVNRAVNPIFATVENLLLEQILHWASLVWFIGLCLLLCYGLCSYITLCRRVRISVRKEGDVYLCDDIDSPFLLGLFRPRIYVPSGLEEGLLPHILAHEQAHIRRRDYIWKPLGFMLLCVYWFNPLLWVGYILLCRDIERACDEKVISQMDRGFRVQYMGALVACSLHRRLILACPVAFGEVSVKTRIKGITRYQRPTAWIIGLSVVTCLVVSVCFLTSPKACAHQYTEETTLSATCTTCGLQTNTCQLCNHTYMQTTPCAAHIYDEGRVTREATCTKTGILVRICTGCGEKRREEIPLAAHTPGELVLTKEPNCVEEGTYRTECTVCHVRYIAQTIPTNDRHTLERTVVKAATCLEDGLAVDACKFCDFSQEIQLKAQGHDFKLHHKQDATCVDDGTAYYNCTACKEKKYVTLPCQPDKHVRSEFYNRCKYCWVSMSSSDSSSSERTEPNVTRPTTPAIRWGIN